MNQVEDDPKGNVDLSGAEWSRSGDVEVAFVGPEGQMVAMRKPGDETGEPLIFTGDEWAAFVGGAKGGEFDLPA